MTHQIVRLMFLAGLAFATPDLVRVKRGYGSSGSGASAGSYASSSSSSSAGGVGGGQPGNGGYSGGGNAGGQGYNGGGSAGGPAHNGGGSGGGGYGGGQVGASAISGSSAGSLSGSGGGGGGGGGYGINSIPNGGYGGGGGAYGNAGGGTYASSFPGGSYAGSGGVPNFGGAPGGFGAPGPFPFNLPAGCATGFQGGYGPDPYQIHQEIMNNLKRIHEDSLRFGSGQGNGFSGPGSHHSSTSFRTADSKHWVATSRDPAVNWPDSWLPHIVKTLGPKNHDTRTRGQGYPAQGGGNNVGAYASGSISPAGGSGGAGVYPSDGLNVRFGDTVPQGANVQSTSGNVPPPKGNFYGVSTSSSSGSQTVDGKTTSFKKSKVTFNEDGKETTYEASSP